MAFIPSSMEQDNTEEGQEGSMGIKCKTRIGLTVFQISHPRVAWGSNAHPAELTCLEASSKHPVNSLFSVPQHINSSTDDLRMYLYTGTRSL